MKLLSRHARGITPTRAGRLLYERACDVLRLLDETGREVTALGRHEREGIVLGLTNGFANIVGRDLVLQARRDLPGVELSLVEERTAVLIDALERHEIDIALAYEVHERPGLLRVPLLEEETLFVAAPGLEARARQVSTRNALPRTGRRSAKTPARSRRDEGRALLGASIPFTDLARYPLVMPGPRDGVRQQVLATAKRLAVSLDVILDVSSVSMMKNMVARGDATAVMPYGNVIDDIAAGRIVGRRIADPPLKRTLYLVRAMRRAPFAQERGVLKLLAQASRQYVDVLGPLATRLPALHDVDRFVSLAATD